MTLPAAADDHHRSTFTFLAYAGLRYGEIRDLCWPHLRLNQGAHGVIELRRGGSRDATKSRRIRRIHINPTLRQAIDNLPRTRGQDRIFSARALCDLSDGGSGDVAEGFRCHPGSDTPMGGRGASRPCGSDVNPPAKAFSNDQEAGLTWPVCLSRC